MKYNPQLDGIRFFAIAMVIIAHWAAWNFTIPFFKNFPWGHGVILFFVLSGFLITNNLLSNKKEIDEKKISAKRAIFNFYTKRFLRIFPIYYGLLFFLKYYNYANINEYFPYLLTYTSNFLQASHNGNLGDFTHFWSLAVEEHFYVLWPILIIIIPHKKLLYAIVGIVILSLSSRIFTSFVYPNNWAIQGLFTLNQFSSFAIGGLIAYFKNYNPNVLKKYFSNPFFAVGASLIYGFTYYMFVIKQTSFYFYSIFDEFLFSLSTVHFISKAGTNGFKYIGKLILESDIIVYLGKISYGLYVYHLFINYLFWNIIAPKFEIAVNNKWTSLSMNIIVLIIISTFSFYLIEKPINSLKKYL